MNTRGIYKNAIAATPERTEEKQEAVIKEGVRHEQNQQDEAILHRDWIALPRTSKWFKGLETKQGECISQAVALASTFHQHNNHQQIVSLLLRAHEIEQQLKQAYE